MCGFAGILTRSGSSRDELADAVGRMIGPIVHRGPDDSGVWADAHAGVALGFRRLAILDVSPSRASADVVAVGPLRRAVQRRGLQLRRSARRARRSAASVSADAPTPRSSSRRSSTGASSGALSASSACSRSRSGTPSGASCSLVRDRLGKKPLYVYARPALVTFGSELKALAAGPAFDRTIDRDALASYLALSLCAGAAEHFRGSAVKLPAGHMLTIARRGGAAAASAAVRSVARRRARRPGGSDRRRDAKPSTSSTRCSADAVRARMVVGRSARRAAFGRHRFVDGRRADAGVERRAVQTFTIGFDEAAFDEARMRRASRRISAPITRELRSPARTPARSSRGCRRSSTSRSPIRRKCRRSSSRSWRASTSPSRSAATVATSSSAATTATSTARACCRGSTATAGRAPWLAAGVGRRPARTR